MLIPSFRNSPSLLFSCTYYVVDPRLAYAYPRHATPKRFRIHPTTTRTDTPTVSNTAAASVSHNSTIPPSCRNASCVIVVQHTLTMTLPKHFATGHRLLDKRKCFMPKSSQGLTSFWLCTFVRQALLGFASRQVRIWKEIYARVDIWCCPDVTCPSELRQLRSFISSNYVDTAIFVHSLCVLVNFDHLSQYSRFLERGKKNFASLEMR
jgi:hypothetical protein